MKADKEDRVVDGGHVTWPALLCLAHAWLMVSSAMVMMVADSPPHASLEIPGIGPLYIL